MRYVSPVVFFDGNLPHPFDKKAILLQRKKLLAELELNGDTLDIKGIKWSKNDILQYFEELQDETLLFWHEAITADTNLLTFLEEYRPAAHFASNPLYKDPNFIAWVSPWFQTAFTHVLQDCLSQDNVDGLKALLAQPVLMTSADNSKAWLTGIKMLEHSLALLQHYLEKKNNLPWDPNLKRITFLLSASYIAMIRLLPNTYNGFIKDKYAFTMMQVSIKVFNRHTRHRKLALSWIDNAYELAISAELKNELEFKQLEMQRIEKHRSKVQRRQWIGAVIGGLFAVFVFFTSPHKESEGDQQDAEPTYQMKKQLFDSITDSILRHNADSIKLHSKPH